MEMKTFFETIWVGFLSIFYFLGLLAIGFWTLVKDLFKKE